MLVALATAVVNAVMARATVGCRASCCTPVVCSDCASLRSVIGLPEETNVVVGVDEALLYRAARIEAVASEVLSPPNSRL